MCGTIAAQGCTYQLRGLILDTDTSEPLDLVNIYVAETKDGVTTQTDGTFSLEGLCAQEYHLTISHIGCLSELHHIYISSDTTITFYLSHQASMLQEATITAQDAGGNTQIRKQVNAQQLADRSSQNIATLLSNLQGVSLLSNGAGISKPVVQGLYGNRVTIYNNGVAQSGQQWGNDHSPEIDPLVANKIEVVRGTDVLAYAGSHLGSMIMVSPKAIGRSSHLHGKANYQYETNGRAHSVNLQMQQYSPILAYRIVGTIKKSGDRSTSNYYLNNTGGTEANLALQLERNLSDNWLMDAYLSTFNTQLGILRGAHIGNVGDLESAIGRDEPFYTEDDFSYAIDAPRQSVAHHLAKIKLTNIIDDNRSLNLQGSIQYNNRQEYDIRRSGLTDQASLQLKQYTAVSDVKYNHKIGQKWTMVLGGQHTFSDNTNSPETGVLPLIPDYRSFETGVFAIIRKQQGKSTYDLGARYDHVLMNAAVISRNLPREIIRYSNTFHNPSASASYKYLPNSKLQLTAHTSLSSRNPAINELYSNGLHQGVSGIEEGDENLSPELGVATTINVKYELHKTISLDMTTYSQRISDYIYLAPQSETRLTIRGSFPVFKYTQTDALIYGLDAAAHVMLSPAVSAHVKYSHIVGTDLIHDETLIDIPANTLSGDLEISKETPIKVLGKKVENLSFEVRNRYTFARRGILADRDYLPAPEAYYLLGLSLSGEMQVKGNRLRIICHVDNLTNTIYRDYLNRQRYFADDLGRNITLGGTLSF